jgi:hypothetical protein
VRNPVRASWLLFVAVLIGSGILLRILRAPWLAAVVIVAFVLMWMALTIVAGRSPTPPARPPIRNVTPVEPQLPAGSIPPPDPARVVVGEPREPIGTLEAKLRALDRMRADGLMTDAEYEAKRAQLIADF